MACLDDAETFFLDSCDEAPVPRWASLAAICEVPPSPELCAIVEEISSAADALSRTHDQEVDALPHAHALETARQTNDPAAQSSSSDALSLSCSHALDTMSRTRSATAAAEPQAFSPEVDPARARPPDACCSCSEDVHNTCMCSDNGHCNVGRGEGARARPAQAFHASWGPITSPTPVLNSHDIPVASSPSASSTSPPSSPNHPPVSTHLPAVSTHSPAVSTHSPPVSTHFPAVSTHSSSVSTHSPAVSTRSPPVSTHSPAISTHSPAFCTHSPPVSIHSAPATGSVSSASDDIHASIGHRSPDLSSRLARLVRAEPDIRGAKAAARCQRAKGGPHKGTPGSPVDKGWGRSLSSKRAAPHTLPLNAPERKKPGTELAARLAGVIDVLSAGKEPGRCSDSLGQLAWPVLPWDGKHKGSWLAYIFDGKDCSEEEALAGLPLRRTPDALEALALVYRRRATERRAQDVVQLQGMLARQPFGCSQTAPAEGPCFGRANGAPGNAALWSEACCGRADGAPANAALASEECSGTEATAQDRDRDRDRDRDSRVHRAGICAPSAPGIAGVTRNPSTCKEPRARRHVGIEHEEAASATSRVPRGLPCVEGGAGRGPSPMALVCMDPQFRRRTLEQLRVLARALSMRELEGSRRLILSLRKLESPRGTALQRTVHYVLAALLGHYGDKGLPKFFIPPPELLVSFLEHAKADIHRVYGRFSEVAMTWQLKSALQGKERVHIVVYTVCLCPDWEDLFRHLAARLPHRNPKVRVTIVVPTKSGSSFSFMMQQYKAMGDDVFLAAQAVGVPVQCHVEVAFSKGVLPMPSDLVHIESFEAVGIVAWNVALYLPDSSVLAADPRQVFLDWVRLVSPEILVLVDVDRKMNVPFFLSRLEEALQYLSTSMDMMDESGTANGVLEYRIAADHIQYISYDGLRRWLHSEPLEFWHDKLHSMGFQQKPYDELIIKALHSELRQQTLEMDATEGIIRLSKTGQPLMFAGAWYL